MRTLGIDLATTEGSTGICEINWDDRTATVSVGKFTDADLAERIRSVQRAGGWTSIDAPFGFPAAFVRAVHDWDRAGTVPAETDDELRRRVTDRYVHVRQAAIKEEGRIPGGWNPWPLSSVVDLITPTVIRCARILTAVNAGSKVDRVGFESHVVEAYPISALRIWDVPTNKYKTVPDDCERIFEVLCRRTGVAHPVASGGYADSHKDDAVDAFVCALLARVVALAGGASGPEHLDDSFDASPDIVRQEGWIHMPPTGHRLELLAAE